MCGGIELGGDWLLAEKARPVVDKLRVTKALSALIHLFGGCAQLNIIDGATTAR